MTPIYQDMLSLLLFLLPAALASALHTALITIGKLRGKSLLQHKTNLFSLAPFRSLSVWETTLFATQTTKVGYYFLFAITTFPYGTSPSIEKTTLATIVLVALYLLIELICLALSRKKAESLVSSLLLWNSLLSLPCLPFIILFAKLRSLCASPPASTEKLPLHFKENLQEYLTHSELGRYLEKTEIHLIQTMITFKNRIVREVMVPRIDMFTLSSETSIQEAARHFSTEGYSRIPVYKENVDKIIGILLYKDVLSIYTRHIENKEPEESLLKTVEHLIKPAIYTPETKKISALLQEFRNKQIHLAIVVDEYGGTEGIVTIEDILEELVGEIEDEYDIQTEKSYTQLSSGGLIVDAKMSIIDLEEDLGIPIPPSSEYDTIGGYIFHRAGAIPSAGWKAHLDDIDLEILSSDARSIRKIKITSRNHKTARS